MVGRKHLAGLDAIRFFAAALVMVYHFFFTFWATRSFGNSLTHTPLFASPQAPFVWFGWVGVQVFFVLSGVVISYTASRSSAKSFLRDRIVRLAPMAWVSSMLGLVILVGLGESIGSSLGRFARETTLFPFGPWIDRAFWTIGVEMSFYGVVFLLLASGTFRYFAVIIAAIGAASTTFLLFDFATCTLKFGPALCSALHRYPRLADLLLLTHGCYFAIGVLIWKRLIAERADRSDWLFLPSGVGCVLQIFLHNREETGRSLSNGITIAQPWIAPMAVWAIALCAIALACRAGPIAPRHAAWLRRIGLATYPLYLTHVNFGSLIIAFLFARGLDLTWSVAVGITACLLLSLALASVVEPRLQALLRAGFAWAPGLPRRKSLSVSLTPPP